MDQKIGRNEMRSNADFLNDSLGLGRMMSNMYSFYKNTFHKNIKAFQLILPLLSSWEYGMVVPKKDDP